MVSGVHRPGKEREKMEELGGVRIVSWMYHPGKVRQRMEEIGGVRTRILLKDNCGLLISL